MSLKKINDVYLADNARVLGDVQLSSQVSIWYGAVVRGDVAQIAIGQGTNVQDGAVIHCDHQKPNIIGANVSIGHGAVVHGLSVGEGSLIGINAIVLGGAKIGAGCLIAAGAIVTPNMQVPDGMVVMGLPGKIVRETTDQEKAYLAWLGPHYVELAEKYVTQPNDLSILPWSKNQESV